MAQAVILDSEALNALAHASQRGVLADRARAILKLAYEHRAVVRVPAPVLAEVGRGGGRDASVRQLLNGRGIGVTDLTARIALRAGELLERCKLSSANAVDAFVASTALEFVSAIIATGDPKDIRRLLGKYPHIGVFRI